MTKTSLLTATDARRVASRFDDSISGSNFATFSAPILRGPARAPHTRNLYEPKPLGMGADVAVPDFGVCQVWSDGPLPRSRWVIPTGDQTHLERWTVAVLVQENDDELTVKNAIYRDYPTATAA